MNPMRQRVRKGFTLIELLVVIGILILLVGIAAFGLSKVINTGKRAQTKVTLENLKSMLSEYEMVSKGLGPARMWAPTLSTANGDLWHDSNPLTPVKEPLAAPRNSIALEANTGGPAPQTPRYSSIPMWNTQCVFQQLLKAPNNKKVQAQFPSSQLLEKLPPGLTGCNLFVRDGQTAYSGVSEAASPPLVLDAWGNPIMFVPSSGLWDIAEGDRLRKQVATTLPPNDSHDGPIKSPDGRSFWASAGPDGVFGWIDMNNNGNFDKGIDKPAADDNMYSFEN